MLLPIRRCPDVLGMSRKRPCYAAKGCRVACDGRWGVHEVRIHQGGGWPGLSRQYQSLSKTPDTVDGMIPLQIPNPQGAGGPISGTFSACKPSFYDAQRLAVKIFGQVEHRHLDLTMNRMGCRVCGMAQRDDLKVHAGFFETADFLRNEGLRQPRITFEHYCNRHRLESGSRRTREQARQEAGVCYKRAIASANHDHDRPKKRSVDGFSRER